VIATLLRVEVLTAGYGKRPVLHEVSLAVSPGELVVIIGPNGAGKSTALKAMVGLLRPTGGRVLFDGHDITGLPPEQAIRRGLAYVPQGRIVFPLMTVEENLEMGAWIERDRRRLRAAMTRVFALFPVLGERRRQMLAIGRALMTTPKMVLLDEPSLGLAPRFVARVFATLTEMKQAGYTLLVVEQNAARALAVADRGYVLDLGRNRLEGTGRALLEDPDVRRLYLGGRVE